MTQLKLTRMITDGRSIVFSQHIAHDEIDQAKQRLDATADRLRKTGTTFNYRIYRNPRNARILVTSPEIAAHKQIATITL